MMKAVDPRMKRSKSAKPVSHLRCKSVSACPFAKPVFIDYNRELSSGSVVEAARSTTKSSKSPADRFTDELDLR